MKKKNILIIGSATLDEIIQKNSSVFKVGGVVTYAGLTYKKHGLHPIIVSNVASEDKEIFHLFQSEKIVHHFGETESTTKFVNRLNGNARIQEMPGGASPITASQINPLLKEVDHIHLGPLHPDDIDQSVFKSVTKNNQSVSLDVQGYVRYVDMDSRKIRAGVSENLHDALHFTDMIKADVYELDVILDAFGMSVQELKDFYNLSEIAITDAEQGGTIIASTGQQIQYAPHPVQELKDNTGAGDVFFAAYFVSRFYNEMGIEESADYAASIATRHIEGKYISQDLLRFQKNHDLKL